MTDYIRITRKKDKLRQKLEALVPGINAALNEANGKSAGELLEGITAFAPELTGEYKQHLRVGPVDDNATRSDQGITTKFRSTAKSGKRKGQTVTRVARAKNTLAYGLFAIYWWKSLEFGHQGAAARPHIYPVYRSMQRRFKSRATRAVNSRIKQVVNT